MLIGQVQSFVKHFNLHPNLITEGGNAIAGVSRINQENVAATMDSVYKKLLPLVCCRTFQGRKKFRA